MATSLKWMPLKVDRLSFLAVTLLSLGFVFLFYGKIILAPNDYLFAESGDAIKNYYTYAFHIKHDTSLINFEGMNYPYGEHFMYTDCHPGLTVFLRGVKTIFPASVDYSVGILNLLMIISFVITSISLWLLLMHFKVNRLFSVLGALGIMMLSPQVFRLGGHLALSYGFFVPLTIYLTLLYFKDPQRWKVLVLLVLLILLAFFTHAYMGMMLASFVLVYWLIYFLMRFGSLKQSFQAYIPLIFGVMVPIFLFMLFMNLTDVHENRTTNPSGFFTNNAEPDDLIVPHYPPLRPFWDSLTKVYQNWEGWAYFGVVTTLILAFIIIETIVRLIKTREFNFDPGLLPDPHFKITLWAAVILLIFSFGWPFKIYPPSIEWFPLVKQFRATGRFTWVFYYSSTVLSVVVIDRLIKRTPKGLAKTSVYILGIIAMVFYGYEGYPYHKDTGKRALNSQNYFNPRMLDAHLGNLANKINPKDYQAILPLPFFHNGSENFKIPGTSNTIRNALILSYYTGTPILGALLTRTGITESKRIIQVISPGYYPKEISQDLSSNLPFLVLKSTDVISEYQHELQDKCNYLEESPNNVLYSLSIDSLFNNTAPREISNFYSKQDELYKQHSFLVTDSVSFIYFDGFDNHPSAVYFRQPGAISDIKKGDHRIADFQPNTFEEGQTYSASLWLYNNHLDAVNFWFRFIMEEYDPQGKLVNEIWTLPEESEVIYGNWSLVELEFQIKGTSNTVHINLKGKDIDRANFTADDLLIREKGLDVYRIEQENSGQVTVLFKNNHQIKIYQEIP